MCFVLHCASCLVKVFFLVSSFLYVALSVLCCRTEVEEAKDQSGINTDLPVDLVPFDKLVKQIGRKVGPMAGAWDVLAASTAGQCACSDSCDRCWGDCRLGWHRQWRKPLLPAPVNGPPSPHGRQIYLHKATVLRTLCGHCGCWCLQAPFDIMGMITSVGTVGSVKRKADNSDVSRREVTLADSR